jgi:hypothetical protein
VSCQQIAPNVIVCGIGPKPSRRVITYCHTCERKRRMVRTWGGVWYGDTWTCLACGESWTTEGRGYRPFRRGWRAEAIARARQEWATALTPREYKRFARDELAASLGAES